MVIAKAKPRLLKVEEVVERTGLNKNHVYNLLKEGVIPGRVQIRKAVRIDEEAFEEWFAAKRRGDEA